MAEPKFLVTKLSLTTLRVNPIVFLIQHFQNYFLTDSPPLYVTPAAVACLP